MIFNSHTYYSLRYGTISVEDLVAHAAAKGWKAFGLTEINNSSSMLDFVKECGKYDITPFGGIEFHHNNTLLYIGVALNNEGFRELNTFLSEHNIQKKPLPKRAPVLEHAIFIYPFSARNHWPNLRTKEYIGVQSTELHSLYSLTQKQKEKLVAWQPVAFLDTQDYEFHRHLRAIDNNTLLSKVRPEQCAPSSALFLSPEEMKTSYQNHPYLLQRVHDLFAKAKIEFTYKSIKNKKVFSSTREEDRKLLTKLALEGMMERYGKNHEDARKRIEKELQIIDELGFCAYFLITWDMVRYALSKGYYHVGRGSGANSIVAYCLKIVDVDPIELDLYFERFINPKRTSPPDFDIDFSWRERDDVQQYLFDKYGTSHCALLGTINTFKGKSIYRELGKVYGLPKEEIDDLIKYPEAERNQNHITRKIHMLAAKMTDFPNLRSIHAGGILISEEPIACYTALDMPPKGFPTTQWDMYVAEDIGFDKLDVLSQRGIGHIRDSVDYIKQTKGLDVDFHQVEKFKNDKKVRELLTSGETLGCFYIESPAMRGLIRKLKCDRYRTLVAASSIIRPGVAKSGMMREYILRYNNPDSFSYLHPVMKEQLEETFGIMVYQEDVLKVCHHFAGLDLGDADILRRAMSGKTRSKDEFNRIVNRFHHNCNQRGYPEEVTKEVWRQIASFAGYSFSKAHSASYAVESFQSLYLKTYFPIEFITAVINNFGGFYRTWVYFNEAVRLGAKIRLPSVNNSYYLTHTDGEHIFIGFVHVQQLERKLIKRIVDERKANGCFASLQNFIVRVAPGLEQLLTLIRCGAFSFTQEAKSVLMWKAHMFLNKHEKIKEAPMLFAPPIRDYKLPAFEYALLTDAYDEIELLGFPVSMNYFDLLKTNYRGELRAHNLIRYVGRKVRMLGHLVAIKYVKTKYRDYMHFATFVDVDGNLFDSVHFPDSLKHYPFRGDGIYLMFGLVVEDFGYAMMEVEKLAKMPLKPNPVTV